MRAHEPVPPRHRGHRAAGGPARPQRSPAAAIVRALADEPTPRRCGSFDLDVTKSTLTHHFRVLREAGVIEQRSRGHRPAELASPRRPRSALPGAARRRPDVGAGRLAGTARGLRQASGSSSGNSQCERPTPRWSRVARVMADGPMRRRTSSSTASRASRDRPVERELELRARHPWGRGWTPSPRPASVPGDRSSTRTRRAAPWPRRGPSSSPRSPAPVSATAWPARSRRSAIAARRCGPRVPARASGE